MNKERIKGIQLGFALAVVISLMMLLTACGSSECVLCGDSNDTRKLEGEYVCRDLLACNRRAVSDILGGMDIPDMSNMFGLQPQNETVAPVENMDIDVFQYEPEIESNLQNEVVSPPEPEIINLNLPIVIQSTVFQANPNRHITSYDILESSANLQGRQGREIIATNVRSFDSARPRTSHLIMWVTNDNYLWGIGSNMSGILGDGTGVDRTEPVLVLDNVAGVYLQNNGNYAYALRTDGTLWRWGSGVFAPEQVAEDVSRIIGNPGETITFQAKTGRIYRLAKNGTITNLIDLPVLETLPDLSFLIDSENKLIRRTTSQGRVEYQEIATDVKSVFSAKSINDNRENIFFITTDDILWGMGNNANGQLGDETRVPRSEPIQLAENVTYARAYAFLTQDATLWTWNRNDPTPQPTLDNVALEFDGHIHLRDGRMIRNFGANNQSTIEDVKIPQTFTFSGESIVSAYPELGETAEEPNLQDDEEMPQLDTDDDEIPDEE